MKLKAAMVLLAVAAATPEVQYFRYERAIVPVAAARAAPPATAQECVPLDAGLYARAAPGLADVRLYRGTGSQSQETPYAIYEAEPVAAQTREIAALNVGSRGGETVFDAAMPEGKYSDVDVDVKAENFLATVSVSGRQAETGAAETKLGVYTIFDLTSQKLGRSTVLHLPESDFRYLHFAIAGPVKPEDVAGVTVERMSQGRQPYVTVAETGNVVQKGHESTVQFTLPAHVPVDRIEFVPGAQPANFSRAVTVKVAPAAVREMTEDEVPRTAEGYGSVLRVHGTHDGRRIDEERLAIDAPYVDFSDAGTLWTVTIDNGDDAPLDLRAVRLEMAERKLCFDAVAGASYTLMYGDAALAAPRYDYATLFTPDTNAAQATPGPEQANPEYTARPDARPFTEKHPGLLWAALILVVLVLGGVALRTAKDTPGPSA